MHPTIMVSGTKSYIYNDRDAKISHHQGFFFEGGASEMRRWSYESRRSDECPNAL